jgi:16S rRNA (guanine527-N7)-methyltransferase
MNIIWDYFKEEAKKIDVFLNAEAVGRFSLYLEELKQWNQKINLFRRKDDREIIIKDFLDSLTVLEHLPLNISLLDIGSGGGFPGIPIKIARDDLRVVLSEVRTKKVFFLRNMVRVLGMNNLEVMNLGGDNKEKFDVAVSRAFGSFSEIIEAGMPFLKKNGTIICLKGRKGQEELSRELPLIKRKGLGLDFVEQIALPISGDKRVLIGLKPNVSRETFLKN